MTVCTRMMTVAALSLAMTGCAADVGSEPGGEVDDPPRPGADASVQDPAGEEPGTDGATEPALALRLSPEEVDVMVGQVWRVTAWLTDEDGEEVAAEVTFTSSDPGVGLIDQDGRAVAMSPGEVTITVLAGGLEARSKAAVYPLDLETCCRQDIDNFCLLPPGTVGCPMTQLAGYCDPNGDASYAELTDADWAFGYQHYAALCSP